MLCCLNVNRVQTPTSMKDERLSFRSAYSDAAMKPFSVLLHLFVLFSLSLSAQEIPTIRGLSRIDLLQIRRADGQIHRASTPQEWEPRRQEILRAFEIVAGPLPKPEIREPVETRLIEEVDCGSYLRQQIEYSSSRGAWVPAYLCIPKQALKGRLVPAVLCLHPTENQIGYKVVVGLGGKPHRQYAQELAERGFVTLSPSYPLLANYQPDLKALGFSSGTMKAIWDNIRGLDLLETLNYVDGNKGFGVIGHSLGGHNAIFTAVFDQRIKVIVSSCGFDSFLDYKSGNLKGWVQERYMLKMADYLGRPQDVPFDYHELIACLAPRRFFVNAPLHDDNFQWQSVDRIAKAASAVYALHQAIDAITIRHPDADHDFPDKERLDAYQVLENVLRENDGLKQ